MSNEFPGDLEGRLLDEDLGPDYFELVVHLIELRLLADWLISQSCFFVVIPLANNEFTLIVKREMRFLLEREHDVQLGLIKESADGGD